MQLVGQLCVHCRERITCEPEARFCPRCGSAVHNACAERVLTAAPPGCCRACGALTTAREEQKHGRAEQRKGAEFTQGYQTVLLGVTLMIGGIVSSMCCTALAGNGRFVVAGGAIFGGAALVVVGFMRSVRH